MNTFPLLCACAAALLLPGCHERSGDERMPESEYRAGAGAVTEIRSLCDTAAASECFALSDTTASLLEQYLLHADTMPQQELDSLLRIACRYNCPDLAEELIKRGADVHQTLPYWDMLDGEGERESTRFGIRTLLHVAAQPSFYTGSATAQKTIRILDMLLAAGVNPNLGDSPLPYVARVEHDHVHAEEVFLRLLDCGLSLDEERVTPKRTDTHRAFEEKYHVTLDKARITPAHRKEVLWALKYRRELGHPWSRAEERLGVNANAILSADDENNPDTTHRRGTAAAGKS